MPSTIVHVGFALAIAAGLLGFAYDRRALLVVGGVVVFADLDAFTSLVVEGSHRAMFHTLLIPMGAGTYLYADTHWREASRVRERYGDYGVRVAWVAIAAFVLSAVGLDMFTAAGVNPFYPLFDQFYSFNGKVVWSSADGFVQTFVEVREKTPDTGGGGGGGGGTTVDVGQKGSTDEYRVGSGVDPSRGKEPAGVERVFPVVYTGWQTTLTLTGIVVTAVKLRWADAPTDEAGDEPADAASASGTVTAPGASGRPTDASDAAEEATDD